MTERRSGQASPPPERDIRPWDTEAIARALGAPAEPRVDQLLGEGVRCRLAEPPGTGLELCPTRRTVRITGEDLQLGPEGVVFELHRQPHQRWLAVSPDGAANLFSEPTTSPEVTESAPQPPDTAEDPNSLRADDDGVSDDSAAPQMVAASPSPDSPSGQEQAERVRLADRLGTDLRYRTTKNARSSPRSL